MCIIYIYIYIVCIYYAYIHIRTHICKLLGNIFGTCWSGFAEVWDKFLGGVWAGF